MVTKTTGVADKWVSDYLVFLINCSSMTNFSCYQHSVNIMSAHVSLCQYGVNNSRHGATWCHHTVHVVSTWCQHGANMVSTCVNMVQQLST